MMIMTGFLTAKMPSDMANKSHISNRSGAHLLANDVQNCSYKQDPLPGKSPGRRGNY